MDRMRSSFKTDQGGMNFSGASLGGMFHQFVSQGNKLNDAIATECPFSEAISFAKSSTKNESPGFMSGLLSQNMSDPTLLFSQFVSRNGCCDLKLNHFPSYHDFARLNSIGESSSDGDEMSPLTMDSPEASSGFGSDVDGPLVGGAFKTSHEPAISLLEKIMDSGCHSCSGLAVELQQCIKNSISLGESLLRPFVKCYDVKEDSAHLKSGGVVGESVVGASSLESLTSLQSVSSDLLISCLQTNGLLLGNLAESLLAPVTTVRQSDSGIFSSDVSDDDDWVDDDESDVECDADLTSAQSLNIPVLSNNSEKYQDSRYDFQHPGLCYRIKNYLGCSNSASHAHSQPDSKCSVSRKLKKFCNQLYNCRVRCQPTHCSKRFNHFTSYSKKLHRYLLKHPAEVSQDDNKICSSTAPLQSLHKSFICSTNISTVTTNNSTVATNISTVTTRRFICPLNLSDTSSDSEDDDEDFGAKRQLAACKKVCNVIKKCSGKARSVKQAEDDLKLFSYPLMLASVAVSTVEDNLSCDISALESQCEQDDVDVWNCYNSARGEDSVDGVEVRRRRRLSSVNREWLSCYTEQLCALAQSSLQYDAAAERKTSDKKMVRFSDDVHTRLISDDDRVTEDKEGGVEGRTGEGGVEGWTGEGACRREGKDCELTPVQQWANKHRFMKRIKETELKLDNVLNESHRQIVYSARFSS